MKDWTGNQKSIFVTLGANNHCEHERENNDYYALSHPVFVELRNDKDETDTLEKVIQLRDMAKGLK